MGDLSVPPSWASTPAVQASCQRIARPPAAAPPGSPANLLGQMALGNMMEKVPAAIYTGSGARARNGDAQRWATVKLEAVIAQLQKQPDAVRRWNVDKADLDGRCRNNGIHAVHVSND